MSGSFDVYTSLMGFCILQVRLFMNRALFDAKSFYCMVNCHLLSFEVCRDIEDRLSKLGDHPIESYGLAFIYAEEAKDARIKSYLDKHLTRDSRLDDMSNLKAYVSRILISRTLNCNSAASCVDINRYDLFFYFV